MFGECISFTNEYVNKGGRELKNRVMFPGTSCFPVSPCKKNQKEEEDPEEQAFLKISENDQLIKIIEQLNGLKSNDFSFLSEQAAVEYVGQVVGMTRGQTLSKRYSESSQQIIDILESLLEFNHLYRASAKELLKHKIFDSIRVKRLERGAPYQIHLPCDEQDAYDYSTEKDNFCSTIKDYQ